MTNSLSICTYEKVFWVYSSVIGLVQILNLIIIKNEIIQSHNHIVRKVVFQISHISVVASFMSRSVSGGGTKY